MNARDELRGYVNLLADGWTPPATTDERVEKLYATVRAEVLREAADKLALELAPEQTGAGPGFLLALRMAMRSLRRMADEAAVR